MVNFKDKEAHYATWGESDAEMLSSDEEDSGFKNGVCFMAGTSKVNSHNHPSSSEDDTLDSDKPLDNIDDAYEELYLRMQNEKQSFHKAQKRIC